MKIDRPYVLPIAAALLIMITQSSCTREAKKQRSLDAALRYFDKGELPAAEIEYKNALGADPGNAEAIKRLGIIRTRQGAHFEAAGILTQAKTKLPKDNDVGIHLAKSLTGLGFVPDSRKELLEVLDRSPDNGEALMLLAEISVTPEWTQECEQRIKAAGGTTSVAVQLVTGLFELRRGAIESGTATVDNVLRSDPGSARAHSLKAGILSSKKLPDEALAELKIAADLAGARAIESIAFCHALVVHARRDEAVARLDQMTKDTPDFLPAWTLLGEIAYREKQDEKATEYFSKVLSKHPVDLNTALMQAEILVRGKQPEKAVTLLEKVAAALPDRHQIHLALAKSLLAADKPSRATGVLDRLLAAFPKLTEATILRARIHLQEGKSAEAIAALEEIHGRESKDAATRDLLIRAYRSAGRKDDAIALLREKSAADGNEDFRSRIELGQLLGSQGKLEEARSVFEDAAETGGFDAVTNLAVLDIKEGKTAEALRRVENYLVAHPDSAAAYTFKAGIEMDLKKPELAEPSLIKALELNPDNAKAFALLLQLKSAPGQEAEALAIVDRYLKTFPKDLSAHLQKGSLQQQLGRDEEARATFLEIIAIHPGFAPAYNNLAALESGNRDTLESAATHARKARSLDPAHPAIADTLGWIEWQLGNYPAALALVTEAAAKMADRPEVLYHLGMAHYSMGQSAQAAAAFTKALATGTDFPGKQQAREHLALLNDPGKDTPTGLDDLKKRVATNPKDIISLLQLAELLARGDQPQDALDTYQKALGVNPATPAALVGQARLYAGPLKSPEKALLAATKARELAPRDPAVLATLGHVKLQMGANEEAYGLLKDASVRLDDNPAVAFDYARAAYRLGRIAEARAAMTRVAAAGTSASDDAKRFLTLTAADAAQQPGIAAEVEQALARDSGNVPALMLRGSLETAAGKSPEATYLQILALQPRFDPARVRLAALFMEDPAKLDQALALASEARSRMTGDQELTRILAIASHRKGDFKYAAQLMAELSTRRPLAPGELLVLGLALAGSNQPDKARAALDQALAAGLPAADAAHAKEALGKLAQPAVSQ